MNNKILGKDWFLSDGKTRNEWIETSKPQIASLYFHFQIEIEAENMGLLFINMRKASQMTKVYFPELVWIACRRSRIEKTALVSIFIRDKSLVEPFRTAMESVNRQRGIKGAISPIAGNIQRLDGFPETFLASHSSAALTLIKRLVRQERNAKNANRGTSYHDRNK